MSLPKPRFAFQAMVWAYILSLSFRLDRLITRWKNGTLPKPRGPRAARQRTAPRAPHRFPLPGGKHWLPRRMPGTGIGAFGGQLRHLLANDAELQALLAAAPQARRMLGPLCRAFGIDVDNPLASPPARPAPNPRPKPAPSVGPPAPWDSAPGLPPPPAQSPRLSRVEAANRLVLVLRR
jgi:hypothetical protein